MKSTARNNGTGGRLYGGDTGLIHIPDGGRAKVGEVMAADLDYFMRKVAIAMGERTPEQAAEQTLCPGCYMVVLVNMAVALAKANGQSLTELGNSLSIAFAELAEGGPERIESIGIMLDPEDDRSRDYGLARLVEALAGGVP